MNDRGTSSDEILDVEQAAEFLHLTPPTVRQMAARNLLPGRRIGKLWRFSRRKLVEFIEAGNPCPSTNDAAPLITGVDSPSAVAAFSNLPERRIAKPPKSTKYGFRVVSGGKPD